MEGGGRLEVGKREKGQLLGVGVPRGGGRGPFGTCSVQRAEGLWDSWSERSTRVRVGEFPKDRPEKQWSEGDPGVSVCVVLDLENYVRDGKE